MTSPNLSGDPLAVRARMLLLLLVIGAASVGGAAYAVLRLRDFSDPENFDGSPLPRPVANAPYIKTDDLVVDKMIEMARITDKDMVFDLGCGDGRLVIASAVQRGSRGVGFDIEPARVTEATENAKRQNVDKLVTIKEQDVFTVDLREADVVVMYLLPMMLEKLIPQFDQCRPGTRIVSHDFPIEGLQTDKTEIVMLAGNDTHRVYLYVSPLKHLPPKQQPWKRKK